LDFSSDGELFISGGSDLKLRVWNLEWGDCKNAFTAHEKTITQIRFIRKSHRCFSASKDGLLRLWDCDKIEELLVLDAHLGEIWTLVVSHQSCFVISAGHDRSIRRWDFIREASFCGEVGWCDNNFSYDDKNLVHAKNRFLNQSMTVADCQNTAMKTLLDVLDFVCQEINQRREIKHGYRGTNPLLHGSSPGGRLWEKIMQLAPELQKNGLFAILTIDYRLKLVIFLTEWLVSLEHTEVAARLTALIICLNRPELNKFDSKYRKECLAVIKVMMNMYLSLETTMTINFAILKRINKRQSNILFYIYYQIYSIPAYSNI
jgi:hypothetical protein